MPTRISTSTGLVIVLAFTALILGAGHYYVQNFWRLDTASDMYVQAESSAQQMSLTAKSESSISSKAYEPGTEEEIPDLTKEPLSVDAGPFVLKIVKITKPADEDFDYLVENSGDASCAPSRPAGYFNELQKAFNGATKTTYLFVSQEGIYKGSDYQLNLIPNLAQYRTVQEVDDDFYVCGVGAMLPIQVTPEWLLFEFSCGGVDEGCGMIGDQIRPTIVLRS